MNIEVGYFFITDITGYTLFLTHSELQHAKEILDSLFAAIVRHIRPPLKVHSTQGDAIIAYTPESAFLNPQTLLDTTEELYFDFRRQLDVMAYNTTCTCQACRNMKQLDLKIFIHHGEYLIQTIGNTTDLQGADVILVHRLMKNAVKEAYGVTGYALLTEAALRAMRAGRIAEQMIPHTESYEHLGPVEVRIHDLQRVWDARRDQRRIVVPAEGAWVHAAAQVPIPQWLAWDYLLDVGNKTRILDMISIERTDPDGGRVALGSKFHCHHQAGDLDYTIVDWEPPDYFTADGTAFGMRYHVTWRVSSAGQGAARVEFNFDTPYEGDAEGMQPVYAEGARAMAGRYVELIDQAIHKGRLNRSKYAGDNQAAG